MTTLSHDSCPGPRVLGGYIDGTLAESCLGDIAHHVTRCTSCRTVVENICELEQPTWYSAVFVRNPAVAISWSATVIIALAVGALVVHQRRPASSPTDAIAHLVAASPSSERLIEPRLSGGFPWAPYPGKERSSDSTNSRAELRAGAAAGVVLHQLGNDHSAQALHAAGLAYLVGQRPEEGVRVLVEASRAAQGDARIWSDLSAAFCANAGDGDIAALRRARDAADRAIHLDPQLAEAYFNRAVTLERLGAFQPAEAAWSEYLTQFPRGPWSAEARERLGRLRRQ